MQKGIKKDDQGTYYKWKFIFSGKQGRIWVGLSVGMSSKLCYI